MQLQMEIWDLDECDFLETKFVEYENEEDFLQDGNFIYSNNNETKGIIMYFSNNDGKPIYNYKPIHMNKEEFEKWEEEKMNENSEITWIKNIYWKLQVISCVLVLRNKIWFKNNVNQLEEIWNIIEKERITGFSHREPNRQNRNKSGTVEESNKCLLTIDKDNKKVIVNNKKENNIIYSFEKNE
jgi:hypothetical protein